MTRAACALACLASGALGEARLFCYFLGQCQKVNKEKSKKKSKLQPVKADDNKIKRDDNYCAAEDVNEIVKRNSAQQEFLLEYWNDFYPIYVMKLATITKMDFKFSNLMHSALVSISGDADEMFVHVQLINSFLRKVFGVEHIRFYSGKGEIRLQEARYSFVYQLAKLISSKLEEQLKLTNSNSLRAI
jgi:hypothetical protein